MDEQLLKKIGVQLTCSPKYEEEDRKYHREEDLASMGYQEQAFEGEELVSVDEGEDESEELSEDDFSDDYSSDEE